MKGYVTLGTNDLEVAAHFYEQLLESIGVTRVYVTGMDWSSHN